MLVHTPTYFPTRALVKVMLQSHLLFARSQRLLSRGEGRARSPVERPLAPALLSKPPKLSSSAKQKGPGTVRQFVGQNRATGRNTKFARPRFPNFFANNLGFQCCFELPPLGFKNK